MENELQNHIQIWKLFNVIVLTSVASGGYAIALLVYILNRGRYHSLIRHALLTSAVGYTAAMLALGTDVGAPLSLGRIISWVILAFVAGRLVRPFFFSALRAGGPLKPKWLTEIPR